MAAPSRQTRGVLERILRGGDAPVRLDLLSPRLPDREPLPPRIHGAVDRSVEALQARRDLLRQQGISTGRLAGEGEDPTPSDLRGNIENLIGYARIPVGVIGPLRVNGASAHGDFYVPLATTEGALVASYHRGAAVLSEAGGVAALCLTESVARAPCFVFENLTQAGLFLTWVLPQVEEFRELVARSSRHARLVDLRTSLAGKEVHLLFEFTTGDAAGQNMITFATDAICRRIVDGSPVRPRRWYLEGNMSGDKKATMLSFLSARGKKVVAEAVLPADLLRRFIHAEPAELVAYWQTALVGGVQSGSIGVQGHYANALAALFIACGQDVACVSEAAVGVTRMDVTEAGALYVSVMLPNLIVGTVGGGTGLPVASECLAMMGCTGPGSARKFAEICAALVLAGEVSITGALASGTFATAHAAYGRRSSPG